MARFFIDRPVFAWVIAIVILLAGSLAVRLLPISQYPEVAPPALAITASYPGASAKVMEDNPTALRLKELETLERMMVEINEYIDQGAFDKIVDTDVRFHDVLYHASRNQRLVDILNNLREQMLRFRSISMHYPGRLAATWEEHRQMVENIADHNSAMARKVAKKHMENSERTLLKGIRQDEESARRVHELFPHQDR